mmetsp:Transcript_22570/g.89305  ORF Transcript_22570/g.89305 Transcript_22570/m.89305 type:complete len:221 (-) Transcript_22570:2155-2817(-)
MGCSVFSGVPRPASRLAGSRASQSARLSTLSCSRPRPGRMPTNSVPLMQQSCCAPSCSTRPQSCNFGRIDQRTRPGRAEASRLPSPPVSTSTPEPFQTLPRVSVMSRRSPLAEASARASQLAGANAMTASSSPSRPAARLQRQGVAWRTPRLPPGGGPSIASPTKVELGALRRGQAIRRLPGSAPGCPNSPWGRARAGPRPAGRGPRRALRRARPAAFPG